MKKINSDLAKITAAAALTIGGITAINALKPSQLRQAPVNKAQAAAMRIRIHYVPGYGINTYTDYEGGRFTGQRVKDGTTWTVLATAYNSKGQTWYEIGQGKWILARYTVSAARPAARKNAVRPRTIRPVVKQAKKISFNYSRAANKASAVVALAQKEVGKRYVWGASGPSAFDCSGLTSYVYAHAAGKNITRTTYTQVHQGRPVSLSNLQPGDLLFWGSKNAPYHVGIYIGGGQYIHAATPSQGVRRQTLSRYFYPSAARRIL